MVKLEKLIEERFLNTLRELMQQRVPARCAFKLTKIVKQVETHLADYNETRENLLKKWSEKDHQNEPIIKDGNYDLSPSSLTEFQKELTALLNTEVEVGTIQMEELGENIEISVQELKDLDGIIVE